MAIAAVVFTGCQLVMLRRLRIAPTNELVTVDDLADSEASMMARFEHTEARTLESVDALIRRIDGAAG